MVAIAVSPQSAPYPRVSVDVSGHAPDGPVSVIRTHLDGSVWPVRGVPASSGGVSQVYDYEAPLGEQVTYTVTSTGTASASATIPESGMWLSVPGLPDYSIPVMLTRIPDAEASRHVGVGSGPFRALPAVEFGRLQGEHFTLEVLARGETEARTITSALRQSGVVLIRLPRTEFSHRYVAVGNISRRPVVRYRRSADVGASTPADWRILSLSCIETASPVGGVFGDPTASYQALLNTGRTYQQLLDWKGAGATTYLDVLRGGF